MQLNKVLKGLAIALPVLAMTACSSTDSATNSGQSDNQSTSPVVSQPIENVKDGMSEEQLAQQALLKLQTVHFGFDQYDIQSDYALMLEAHAAYLRTNRSVKVLIEGHADERGTPEYNIALGERRANAVANYLQALGVSSSQLSIVSYGEEKPVAYGQSEASYAKNRRAVLVY
ncbi:peptidoglycan-associated lipoprotein Pal [Thaumasiovibrio subtropicus]|uniref:peptidoglycan-associated lipoprotein Pal n=1 Tax=Thaumasiovibrio subtropicus TaxID=1891207 RepID=UPI000B34E2E1|nr:peptidoglycan-associated lipoprotein Pal [Thaumasiovibrio subtropicus]